MGVLNCRDSLHTHHFSTFVTLMLHYICLRSLRGDLGDVSHGAGSCCRPENQWDYFYCCGATFMLFTVKANQKEYLILIGSIP